MEVQDAIGQAYKNGYEAGKKELEADNERLRDMWAKAVSDGSKALSQIPRWIPVAERLPKLESYVYSVDVLFYVPYENIYVGYVNLESGTWKCKHSRNLFAADKVTHWMPLPEPPKGE